MRSITSYFRLLVYRTERGIISQMLVKRTQHLQGAYVRYLTSHGLQFGYYLGVTESKLEHKPPQNWDLGTKLRVLQPHLAQKHHIKPSKGKSCLG